MMTKAVENQIAKWLYIGAPIVTLFVTSSMSYDPVNVSKLVAACGVGFAVLFMSLRFGLKDFWQNQRPLALISIAFLGFSTVSLFASTIPTTLSFYGAFGRNTGYLAYFALLGILLGATQIKSEKNFKRIVYSLLFAGAANVIYCLLAILGYDFIKWNNIYKTILGTFGNPDFISAFLGMAIVAALAIGIGKNINWKVKLLLLAFMGTAFFEIKKSHAIQGVAVTGIGIAVVGFYFVRSTFAKNLYLYAYSLVVGIVGGFAVAGTLQIGPLTKYVYKTSVSLRGEYWRAGLKMGMDHPLTGVGWDAYGNWYRRTRDAGAMILPGPKVVTNASHNVFIDFFASGGFPVIATYLGLLLLAGTAVVKVTLRKKPYEPVFVAITAAWICYHAQAFISINQIGLAIWGWLLTGLLIAYERFTREAEVVSTSKKKESDEISGYLIGAAGLALGIGLALPPFISDANWRSSISAASVEKLQAAGTKWPKDPFRMGSIAITFEQNKFSAQALELTRKAIEYDPTFYDSWRVLAGLSGSTEKEKAKATEMMHKLDPRNKKLE